MAICELFDLIHQFFKPVEVVFMVQFGILKDYILVISLEFFILIVVPEER